MSTTLTATWNSAANNLQYSGPAADVKLLDDMFHGRGEYPNLDRHSGHIGELIRRGYDIHTLKCSIRLETTANAELVITNGIMDIQPGYLAVYWGRFDPGEDNDICFMYGSSKADAHMLHNMMCGNLERESYVYDLQRRGYDMNTFQFFIEKKS